MADARIHPQHPPFPAEAHRSKEEFDWFRFLSTQASIETAGLQMGAASPRGKPDQNNRSQNLSYALFSTFRQLCRGRPHYNLPRKEETLIPLLQRATVNLDSEGEVERAAEIAREATRRADGKQIKLNKKTLELISPIWEQEESRTAIETSILIKEKAQAIP